MHATVDCQFFEVTDYYAVVQFLSPKDDVFFYTSLYVGKNTNLADVDKNNCWYIGLAGMIK